MPELSNLLRERLGVRPVPRVHPDPDLLNAFSENALGGAERSQVAEHLSACAYCREVLAVALPETEAQPAAVPAAARKRPFWRMPAFGLAATAAAVVAIGATFVLELQQRQSPGTQVAQQQETRQPVVPANVPPSNQEQPSAAAQNEATPALTAQAPSQQPEAARTLVENDRVKPQTAARTRSNAPVAVPTRSGSHMAVTGSQPAISGTEIAEAQFTPKRDYVNDQMFSQANFLDSVTTAPAAAPPAFAKQQSSPIASQTFLINGQNNTPLGIPANAIEPSKILKPIGPVPSQRPSVMAFIGGTGAKVGKIPGKIGPAISSRVASGFGMHSQVFGNALQSQHAEAVPSASPTPLAGALVNSDGFTALALSAPHSAAAAPDTLHWKISGSTLMKSTDAAQWQDAFEASVPLTFVTSRGSDVWAGGAQGKLLHSSDRGQHWEEFQPDQSASGNVLSIELAGNSVTAKTSTNQIWSSQDGGKSWVRVTPQE